MILKNWILEGDEMDWTDVLKVQVLGSKQKVKMGIKPLPKNEDNHCLRRMSIFIDKLQNLYDKYYSGRNQLYKKDILGMTEESACHLLNEFERSEDNMKTDHDFWDEYYAPTAWNSEKPSFHFGIKNTFEYSLETTRDKGNRISFDVYYTGHWEDGIHQAYFSGHWTESENYHLEDLEEELKKLFREA